MTAPFSEATLATIEATVPALEAAGGQVVQRLYHHLLADPEIRSLFNMSHQEGESPQHKALAGAILAYAQNIRQPQVLAAAIERIAQKHVALQIMPHHYDAVEKALMAALGDVLGEAATPEIAAAWQTAYRFLASILIDREKTLYEANASAPGGWDGWRRFVITEKHQETAEIASFVLKPVDGGAVAKHLPGQYLTVLLSITEEETVRRNYSISCAPNGDAYRITVKHAPQGKASGWLHAVAQVGDEIDVAAPAGHFYLDLKGKSEVILVSGGVGLTPMISMLEATSGAGVPITYIHAARNGTHHAMGAHHRTLADRSVVFYDTPEAADAVGVDYEYKGQISAEWLVDETKSKTADYYICGPTPFMRSIVTGLKARGVTAERIHYEFFGPESESF